jgi:site-specific recombinase XerD
VFGGLEQQGGELSLRGSRRKTAEEAFADYFGAKIANDNTREAYLRDTKEFAAWISEQSLTLTGVSPLHVAGFREQLRENGNSPATIKRKISALRKLFAYLTETGVLISNPAREVATEKVRVKTGKTPALSAEQMRQLFESFDSSKPTDLRDRALIAVMSYSLARVSAALDLRANDLMDLGRTQVVRLQEKGGVQRDIPAHPKLVEYLDKWIAHAGLKGTDYLFPALPRTGGVDRTKSMTRGDALRMVKRRLLKAGVPAVFSNHSFRATGITEFLTNGGDLETAQQLANHADSRTTKLYDRRATRLELEEIVRIRF